MSDKKSILVTGGAGFVGQNLVRRLVTAGKKVIVIDKSPAVHDIFQSDNVESICADITSAEVGSIYKKTLPETEFCFHLAAVASVQQSQEDWLSTHEINSVAFVKLLDAISKTNLNVKVIYASSAAVYGDKQSEVSESDTIDPISIYGYDKAACEKHAKIAHDFFNISSLGLRFFNIYGPGQNPHSDYSGVISRFLQNITDDIPVNIHGDGEQVRDFIYIDDVINSLMLSMNFLSMDKKINQMLNICTGEKTSINELVSIMYDLVGKEANISLRDKNEGDIFYSLGNSSKARELIGFSSETDLKEGLRKYLSAVS